jgi:hypothetical protein
VDAYDKFSRVLAGLCELFQTTAETALPAAASASTFRKKVEEREERLVIATMNPYYPDKDTSETAG